MLSLLSNVLRRLEREADQALSVSLGYVGRFENACAELADGILLSRIAGFRQRIVRLLRSSTAVTLRLTADSTQALGRRPFVNEKGETMDGITPGKTDSIIIGGGGRLKCGGQPLLYL